MRQSDRSPKWDQSTIRCYRCEIEKPIEAFIIQRTIGPMVTSTCAECRTPRSVIDKIRAAANTQRYRARGRGSVNTLTSAQWTGKLAASNGFCYLCHTYVGIENLTIDHIVALNKGGENTIENVEPACWPCNHRKYTH